MGSEMCIRDSDMKEQCKLAVTGDAAWERVADDPRFRPLLDRLAAA